MRQTIGTKIGIVLGLSLAALVIVGGQSHRATSRLIVDAEGVEQSQRVQGKIASLLAELYQAETLQRGYLLTGASRYLESYAAAVKAAEDNLSYLLQLTAGQANQQRRLTSLSPIVRERFARLAEGVKARTEGGLDGAARFASEGVGSRLMNQIRAITSDMSEEEQAVLAKRTRESHASSRAALAAIRYGIPLAIAVVCVIGLALARNITRPLNATTAIAESLATGDVSVEIPSEMRRDEAGVLLQAFRRMAGFQREMARVAGRIAEGDLSVPIKPQSSRDQLGHAFAAMLDNLRRLTGMISESANVLAAAASEISTSVSQVAASSTETAAAVSETTVTVEEVRQTSKVASERARMVADNSQQAATVSLAGRQATDLTVAKINDIRQQMEAIAESIVRLSEQSQAIGTIIETVDDIAEQSNLLAVNAAIEAAKAGEHGRGFEVVAREIKNLAAESKQATGQVRGILSDIQRATSAAVMATEQGSKAVESGLAQSRQTGESIQALAGSIQEAANAALQIAASSQQQVAGMTQVAQAMGSIKQASNQNVDSMAQLKSAADNLRELSAKLQELVAFHRV